MDQVPERSVISTVTAFGAGSLLGFSGYVRPKLGPGDALICLWFSISSGKDKRRQPYIQGEICVSA